jgi:hypothetical protein
MKESELGKLKKVLKPLVMECIKEAIFEEGVLSTLVAEIVSGMGTPITEIAKPPLPPASNHEERTRQVSRRLQETKDKMLSAIGKESYGGVDLFEGTKPLSKSASAGTAAPHSPLANRDPDDAGINIDGLLGVFGNKWDALK